MKWALLFLGLSTAIYAVDPPYPTSTVEGYYIRDLDLFYKLAFEPGTLENCLDQPQTYYTFYSCDLKGAEVNIDNGTKKFKFILASLSATEMAGSGTTPASMSYYFTGKYGTTLPDGTTFETDASFSFSRKLSEPDRLQGTINVYSLGINAGVVMKWPSASAPSPTPTRTR